MRKSKVVKCLSWKFTLTIESNRIDNRILEVIKGSAAYFGHLTPFNLTPCSTSIWILHKVRDISVPT